MRSVYTSKIISSPSDLVALVFYGTEQSKNPRDSFKHVYVYHSLDEPGKIGFVNTVFDTLLQDTYPNVFLTLLNKIQMN